MQHIQYNESNGTLQVINNLPTPLENATAHVTILSLDGTIASESDMPVNASESSAVTVGLVEFPGALTNFHFLKLDLKSAAGKLLSANFYWMHGPHNPDDLTDLHALPDLTLQP